MVLGRNYLRVRGEYKGTKKLNKIDMELPPRARRIPTISTLNQEDFGTTSACAENTVKGTMAGTAMRNYLRVRGEYFSPRVWSSQRAELPPRARRIRIMPGE